jgi:hypothetical protein
MPAMDNTDSNPAPPRTPPATLHHKHLARLRNRRVARLLSGSPWLLKAWQLALDCPPSILTWLDERWSQALASHLGKPVDLDALHVDFTTDQDPAVDATGNEHFEWRLSLRQLGRMTLETRSLLALQRCAVPDRTVHDDLPGFTLEKLFKLLLQGNWSWEYDQQLSHFWARHGQTWQMLARLSFLDGLDHQQRRRQISRDGYRLGLDVLGLVQLPDTLQRLGTTALTHRSTLHGVMLNDDPIPGVFHQRSRTTGHCYIHVLGEQPYCHEYISDTAPWKPEKVMQALNASPWHRLHLNLAPTANGLELGSEITDVFTYLCNAQRLFALIHPETEGFLEVFDGSELPQQDYLLPPIEPALAILAALGCWHSEPGLRESIPTPHVVADRIMGKWLKQAHGIDLDPRRVFIRYRPGTSRKPWGSATTPATNILIVPSERPVALSQALVQNFRALEPSGYDDLGGRWVVYTDLSGQGTWKQEKEIPVTAASIEAYIRSIGFLEVMTTRLNSFWERKATAIERALSSTLIAQALFCLKNGELTRKGFNWLVLALEEDRTSPTTRQTRWSALGFQLDSGHLTGGVNPPCPGLLLLHHEHEPGWILYQAGQKATFVELRDRAELVAHLRQSAANEDWRRTLLQYTPMRFHERLDYILQIWGGVEQPPLPPSILRPTSIRLYNDAIHKAGNHVFFMHEVAQSPTGFILEHLRSDSLHDAQDSIVTQRELTLNYWSRWVDRLQLMLAPMALLLPPVAIASLTASAASLALKIQAASLPGDRDAERRQVLVAILSLGLLQLGPATPRLLGSFMRVGATARLAPSVAPSVPLRNFGTWLQRLTHPRKTVLSPYFNTGLTLKNWEVAANRAFASESVRVWKLGQRFLLWTSQRAQARTLVVSSHGYHLPWSRATQVPNGTELRLYAPHGHELVDPGLHKVVSQLIKPYALLDNTRAVPGPGVAPFATLTEGKRLLAGTTLPGHIKNYKLMKFQSDAYESYQDISNFVSDSQHASWPTVPATPMDVLTIRNRFGVTSPSLEDLFNELQRLGIHYDKILLVHCRCSAIKAVLGRAPAFDAPGGTHRITP